MISFHDLYQKYARDVYRFAYWLSGDAAEAEDIASETFVRAWTAFDDLKMPTVKAYLFTIARNLYLHSKRRTNRLAELDPELMDPAPDALETAEKRSELDRVMKHMQTLPEVDRAALLLRAQYELSYEEIAQSLGISLAAVKVKIHRARLKLTALLPPR
jgi:RNA polymerase sigma-70 factor (ECF subfamily)